MTDQAHAGVEKLFSLCVNAVDKYGVVDETGMQEALAAITQALEAAVTQERERALEAVKELRDSEADGLKNMHYLDACDAIAQAIRENRP